MKIKRKISDALGRLELTAKSLVLFLVISLVISIIGGIYYSRELSNNARNHDFEYFSSFEFGEIFNKEISGLEKEVLAILYKKDRLGFTRAIKERKENEISVINNDFISESNKLAEEYIHDYMGVLPVVEQEKIGNYVISGDLDVFAGGVYSELPYYEKFYKMTFDKAKELGISQDKIDYLNLLGKDLSELNTQLVTEKDRLINEVNKSYALADDVMKMKEEFTSNRQYEIFIKDPVNGIYASSTNNLDVENLTHVGEYQNGMSGRYIYYQEDGQLYSSYGGRVSAINEYISVGLDKLNKAANSIYFDKNYQVLIAGDIDVFTTGVYSDAYIVNNMMFVLKVIGSIVGILGLVFMIIKTYEMSFFEFYRKRNIHLVFFVISSGILVYQLGWTFNWTILMMMYGYFVTTGVLILSDITYIVNHGFKKRFIKEKRVKSKKKGMNIQKLRESIFSKNLKKGDKVLRIMYISGIVFGVITIIVSGFFALDTLFRFSDDYYRHSHWILNYWPKWVISIMAVIGPIIMIVVHLYQGIKLRKIQDDIADIDRIIDNIANGDFDVEFRSAELRELTLLRENIASIDKGFKVAVEDELKSARMKSELITNVSHDLKTPLTSIINYVDLLKVDDISELDREEYLRILDNKSKRLKALIEDLFEASKASTGNIILNIENIDMVSVLRQAFAEFKEKIDDSTLDFKINIPEGKVNLDLDGAKLWRVFENLIGNAIKYSMDNSRVYIELREYKDKVVFEIKNMSGYELNCNPSELKERFKRADASRHTEGSGLGLAIANSLVELQGGTLDIAIDGDLFKVKVIFEKK